MSGVKGRSGRKPTNPTGRLWFRSLVDQEELRSQFERNLRAKLAEGDIDAFMRTFEHAYGRPGTSVDVTTRVQFDPAKIQFVLGDSPSIEIGSEDG
jgi:hypothetical protein